MEDTEVRKIVIRSQGDAIRHFLQATRRKTEINQPVEVVFDGWPLVKINVKGKRYHSSMPTPLMEALVDYQAAINRVYANFAYDKGSVHLTQADRRDLVLNFEVKEGSTGLAERAYELLNGISEKLVDRLSPKELLILILGLSLILAGYSAFDKVVDRHYDSKSSTERHEEVMQALRGQDKVNQALQEIVAAHLGIVKSVPDATSIKIGTHKLDQSDIARLTEKSRSRSDEKFIDGSFIVDGVTKHATEDKWIIDLVNKKNGDRFRVDLFSIERAAENFQMFGDHLKSGEPLELTLRTRVKDGSTISAHIYEVGSSQENAGS